MSALAQSYTGLSAEHFARIHKRYMDFLEVVNDVNTEPVKVFDPLPAKSLAELQLIRGISVDLQKKKEDDVQKAARLKEEADAAAAAEAAAEATKEKNTEEEKEE